MEDILRSRITGQAAVMGILNVTPDSFSDGGRFLTLDDARARAAQLLAEGADIIDIGAESTRPGSERVSPAEQINRLREVLPAVCRLGGAVSIDTTSSEVAAFALDAGAAIINDVSAGRDDPAILALAARRGCPVVLMHMLGQPKTMQADPHYQDVVAEVAEFLQQRVAAAGEAGVPRERCIVDPGIGFGKTMRHNLALLAAAGRFAGIGGAVLVGPSRKRFIGELSGAGEPSERVHGTVAACLAARAAGASLFRVHDVAPLRQALDVWDAIGRAPR